MINETIIETAKETAYIPSLLMLWISMLILIPLVIYIFKSPKTDWGKFWGAWFFIGVLSGIILTFLIYAPNFISEVITKLKGLI